jgi:hypothetical protein
MAQIAHESIERIHGSAPSIRVELPTSSSVAPRPWSRVEPDDDGAERAASGISFTVVSVFDISQTDPLPGHPHPWHPPRRHAATGDVAAARALACADGQPHPNAAGVPIRDPGWHPVE